MEEKIKKNVKLTGVEMASEIARAVSEAGGRAYYVGGFVRDKLQHIDNKDIDIEIHGIEPTRLEEILDQLSGRFGRSGAEDHIRKGVAFGVFGIRGYDIDIAMPRTERATGRGHRDFEVFVDPFIGPEKAARRRDFTVNALMEDVLTGEVLDFFGGRDDLAAGVIRHVDDDSFDEDPLRVLRAAQFAARFGFEIAEETREICRGIDLSALSRERVFEETKKALLKAERPSRYFEILRDLGQLDCWFPELKALIGVEQSPIYHPEGDVWVHTMQVLDHAAEIVHSAEVAEKTGRADFPALYFLLSALCHDLGKPATSRVMDGRIRALGHETKGVEVADAFLHRLTDERDLIRYVKNMVELHMKPNSLCGQGSGVKATNRMFDRALDPEALVFLARCDRRKEPEDLAKAAAAGAGGAGEAAGGPSGAAGGAGAGPAGTAGGAGPAGAAGLSGLTAAEREAAFEDFLWGRLAKYREIMSHPQVTGEDLIAAGVKPGPGFSEMMEYAHNLHLSGVAKDEALKQTLAEFTILSSKFNSKKEKGV